MEFSDIEGMPVGLIPHQWTLLKSSSINNLYEQSPVPLRRFIDGPLHIRVTGPSEIITYLN